jgi:hypothetical protein
VAALAGGQHHVVSFGELVSLGISSSGISRWAARGRLRRRHRGIYVYGGGDLTRDGEFFAAVRAIGDDAFLSDYGAAALWDFWSGTWKPIDVTVARQVRSRSGIRVHSVAELPEHATTMRYGIPVTTAPWTILDLAAHEKRDRRLRRLVHEALAQERISEALIRREVARSPWHPGAKRALAEFKDGAKPTRSGDEDDLVELLRRHDAPPFDTLAHVPGTPPWVEVDVMFRHHPVVIELDAGPWHETPYRQEFDAFKRSLIADLNIEVLVLGDEDVRPAAEAETKRRIWGLLELG